MVADAAARGRQMGLGISNDALAKKIAGDETFQDPSGNSTAPASSIFSRMPG